MQLVRFGDVWITVKIRKILLITFNNIKELYKCNVVLPLRVKTLSKEIRTTEELQFMKP